MTSKVAVVTGGSRGHRPRVRRGARRRGLDRGDRLPNERGRREGDARRARGDRDPRARGPPRCHRRGQHRTRRSGVSPTRPGTVTGLVNNAGTRRTGSCSEVPDGRLRADDGHEPARGVPCARAALRGMLREKWGRIVNMSSAVALHGNAGQTVYAATKAGLVGLTKSLAREVGAKGITVNALCPGLLDTDMTVAPGRGGARVLHRPDAVAAARHARRGVGRRSVPDVGRGVVRERGRDPGGRWAHRVGVAAAGPLPCEPHTA